jgi:hypothetical protein
MCDVIYLQLSSRIASATTGMTDNIRDNLTSVFLNFYHQSLIIVFVRANGL